MGFAYRFESAEILDEQKAAILDCPFVEIRDAGHISTLEAAEPVTGLLVRFLADTLGREVTVHRSAV
jgi:hypothetical protein